MRTVNDDSLVNESEFSEFGDEEIIAMDWSPDDKLLQVEDIKRNIIVFQVDEGMLTRHSIMPKTDEVNWGLRTCLYSRDVKFEKITFKLFGLWMKKHGKGEKLLTQICKTYPKDHIDKEYKPLVACALEDGSVEIYR